MDDVISRQSAIDAITEMGFRKTSTVKAILQRLETLPSAQRTGRWIVVSDGYENGEATACICECSECKDTIWVYKKSDRKWNYCPNCGARMEETDERT